MKQALSILLVGYGRMGSALAQGWKNISPSPNLKIIVRDKKNNSAINDNNVFSSINALPNDFDPDVIIFAVKPQMLDDIMPLYADIFDHSPLYISVAAGKNLEYYQSAIGEHSRIIRAMPNTPSIIGKGITALCASSNANERDKSISERLMKAVGKVVWLDDESQMDAVTAISGSGPAYVFYFMECMVAAGIEAGLSREMAESLTKYTIYGSSELANQSDNDLTTLRKNVTSPNGTTQAALDKWMQSGNGGNGLMELTNEAIQAAIKRSKELRV